MEAGALRAEKQQNEEIVRNLKDPVILEKIVFHLPFSTTFGTKQVKTMAVPRISQDQFNMSL